MFLGHIGLQLLVTIYGTCNITSHVEYFCTFTDDDDHHHHHTTTTTTISTTDYYFVIGHAY
jgi:hypothetical protein